MIAACAVDGANAPNGGDAGSLAAAMPGGTDIVKSFSLHLRTPRLDSRLCARLQNTPRRPCESMRKQGPTTTGSSGCGKVVGQRLSKQMPRRMGPCFRRDDTESLRGAAFLAAPAADLVQHARELLDRIRLLQQLESVTAVLRQQMAVSGSPHHPQTEIATADFLLQIYPGHAGHHHVG